MARPTNVKLQERLDIIKWLDSEKAGADQCGTYVYCKFEILNFAELFFSID